MQGRSPTPRSTWTGRSVAALAVAFALLTGSGGGPWGTAPATAKDQAADLPPAYRDWLAEVSVLISKAEREAFLKIDKDYQRDAFIERFWRARDPYPATARNEFRVRWDQRAAEVRATIGSFSDERARVLLFNGNPDARIPYRCTEGWPGEVWYYANAESVGTRVILLFYQRGGLGDYRIWDPTEGVASLLRFASPNQQEGYQLDELVGSCRLQEGDALRAAVLQARQGGGMGQQMLVAGVMTAPEQPSEEWVATFDAYNTDLPVDAEQFEAELEFDFPGPYQSRTIVQGVVKIQPTEAMAGQLATHRSYNLLLTGEVLKDAKLFDSFRYNYNIPEDQIGDGPVPLVFERNLRPGDYNIVVKVEDLNAHAFFGANRELSVPAVEHTERTPTDPETARLLAEANAAIASGETSIQIVPPRGELQTGMSRIDTLTTGNEITRVAFSLDDGPALIKKSPPWNVELDLGSLPRMRKLVAVAYDAAGNEVARDEERINAGAHRFSVRLIEPRRNKKYSRSLRAQAELEVPEDQVVERLEFYLNEALIATLYQEPWVQPIVLPPTEQIAYVRVVAYEPDGNSTEDLVFVNAPEYLEEVDIQFVELYVTVLDRANRPVEGLSAGDFSILEDEVPQSPVRFDRVRNLPIHAGILLDTSASMEERLEVTQQAALQFFQEAITPKDRATLITFNDHPNLAAKFTNKIDQLASGLAGLKAERGTALWDSVVFSLYYFNGVKGQRALIILSDGKDEQSRFSYEETLEYARRAGVAVYSIGLAIKGGGDARRRLTRIAEETGGRSFFVDDPSELAAIYEAIQRELRSRYYIAYQSTNTSEADTFRRIDVEVAKSGLEAKTLRGYYP
jgi:Ca-activated chloride channel homolog